MLYQKKKKMGKIEAKEMREMKEEVKMNWSRGESGLSKEGCNLLVEPELNPVS